MDLLNKIFQQNSNQILNSQFLVYYLLQNKMFRTILILLPLQIMTLYGCASQSELGLCNLCEDGFYLTQSKSCQKCSKSCEKCISKFQCLKCDKVSVMYLNRCFQCNMEGCLFCKQDNQCQLCDEGYYKFQNKCQKCPQNCKDCNSSGCKSCNKGYSFNLNGKCVSTPQTQNPEQKLNQSSGAKQNIRQDGINIKIKIIIAVVVSIVLLLIVVITIFTIIKCRNKKLQKKSCQSVVQNTQNFPTAGQPDPIVKCDLFPNLFSVDQTYSIEISDDIRTHTKQFSNESNRDICAICLSKRTDIRTSCTHQFHTQCLAVWCHKKYSCPDCNNKSFVTKAKCSKCKRFCKSIKICDHTCQNLDHFVCFQRRYGKTIICSKCS